MAGVAYRRRTRTDRTPDIFYCPLLSDPGLVLHEGCQRTNLVHLDFRGLQAAGARGCRVSQPTGCVTLHAVRPSPVGTIMPHARGSAPVRRDPPETRRWIDPPMTKTVASPGIATSAIRLMAISSNCYAAAAIAGGRISTPTGMTPAST